MIDTIQISVTHPFMEYVNRKKAALDLMRIGILTYEDHANKKTEWANAIIRKQRQEPNFNSLSGNYKNKSFKERYHEAMKKAKERK